MLGTLSDLGRHAEAQAYFDKALELGGEPKTADEWVQRGLDLWTMDRPEEALHVYLKALELNPRTVNGWRYLWDLFEEQGRYRLWHRMAEQMTALLPEEPKLWFYFGTANATWADTKRRWRLTIEHSRSIPIWTVKGNRFLSSVPWC